MEVTVVIIALLAGVIFKSMRLPPMVGFLAAGFALMPMQGLLPELAGVDFTPFVNAGVTLLLFCIGLKLELRTLFRPFVWGVTSAHMLSLVLIYSGVLLVLKIVGWTLLKDLSWSQGLTIGFALSFSSTVFAVKVLEERGEMAAMHGKAAIGVLVMQDIFAVIYLTMVSGKIPSIYAPLVLLLIPARGLLVALLKRCGHSELLVLAGFAIAFGAYALFDLVGLKGDLGALFVGAVLASSDKGKELVKSLMTIKDLLLVGFFLSIGQYGLPSDNAWLMAFVLTALVLIKPLLFFLLFARFKLRAQTAFLGGLALNHYSEFGLIVLSIAVAEGILPHTWLVILALALSFSFVISSLINLYSHKLYTFWIGWLVRFQTPNRVLEEQAIDIGNAKILIAGMGLIGTGAYDYLIEHYGDTLVGIEESPLKVDAHNNLGRRVVLGDVSDRDLWKRLPINQVKKVILAFSNHAETVLVTNELREIGYTGVVAAVAKFDDHLEELRSLGVIAFNFYSEAGAGFAEHVMAHIAGSDGAAAGVDK